MRSGDVLFGRSVKGKPVLVCESVVLSNFYEILLSAEAHPNIPSRKSLSPWQPCGGCHGDRTRRLARKVDDSCNYHHSLVGVDIMRLDQPSKHLSPWQL